jgi:quinol monooxygenase YgiN
MMAVYGRFTAAAILIAASGATALAQAPGPTDVVTYIEVTPSGEAEAAGLLRQLAAASRKEAGSVSFTVLQHIERPSQFAILETWSDAKAHEAHDGGPALQQFREKLDHLRVGFYDERLDTGIDVAPLAAPPTKDAIYVVTHVDVTGQFKDDAIVMINKLAADSRKEPGAERFELWQQNNRLNHFTLVEIWKDRAALDAHLRAGASREFREKVGRMLGALYDDRRYRSLE